MKFLILLFLMMLTGCYRVVGPDQGGCPFGSLPDADVPPAPHCPSDCRPGMSGLPCFYCTSSAIHCAPPEFYQETTDPDNCGECGRICPEGLLHTQRGCDNGQCIYR